MLLALRQRKLKDESQSEHNNDEKNTDDANANNDDEPQPRSSSRSARSTRASTIISVVSAPIRMSEQTQFNLGKVHYQLAILHGMGRFPEIVPDVPPDSDGKVNNDEKPPHDSFSVLFHLSYAASFRNAPACLSLGRAHAGLGTHVSELLDNPFVPLDFDAAKDLLRRAMDAAGPSEKETDDGGLLMVPMTPRVAAGCLLFQILQDERHAGKYATIDEDEEGKPAAANATTSVTEIINVAEDTLKLFELMDKQKAEADKVKDSLARTGMVAGTGNMLQVGDRVEGDYFMEGTYYPGTVLEVTTKENSDGEPQFWITVQYDDDGSSEMLPRDHVRMLIPPTATQTTTGGPLSDEEAFGTSGDDQDDEIPIKTYELLSELAELKVEVGDNASAAEYYQQAADGAMEDNKMKKATEWSLKAAELTE